MTEEVPDFFALDEPAPPPPPSNIIPFPRMRPSRQVVEAWRAAVASRAEKNRRTLELPSPLDVVPNLIKKRSMPALPWPEEWPGIARRCRTYVGECVSVTAAIGGGKTSFAIQTARAVCGSGHPVLWAALELDPEQVDLRIVANMYGVGMTTVREKWPEDRITHALVSVADMWHYVDYHDEAERQFIAIEDAIDVAWDVYRLPPLLIVDHLGELVAEERDDRAAIRKWAQRFRRLALRKNCWGMLLNQVSKGNQGAITGKVEHDSATDTMAIEMGSQAIASAVSNSIVLNVFKSDDKQELDAHALIPKARNTGEEGREGMRLHKKGGRWQQLDYTPVTPVAAKAAAEADKRDKHRTGPARSVDQARADLNAARAGDAAASRRQCLREALLRHGMIGMGIIQIRRIPGIGRGPQVHQALQELERAGDAERTGHNHWRIVHRTTTT